jgi:hypothetical protein
VGDQEVRTEKYFQSLATCHLDVQLILCLYSRDHVSHSGCWKNWQCDLSRTFLSLSPCSFLSLLSLPGWPQYPLQDEERWPEGGSINYNTILQLDMLCKKEGKWTEVPYVQLFFFLRDHPEGVNKWRLDTQTMVTLCKEAPNSLEPNNQSDALSAPPLPLTQLPHTPDIVPQDSTSSS